MAVKELKSVATIVPFPNWKGERVSCDKRCYTTISVDTGTVDGEGKAVRKDKRIPTGNKVEIQMPISKTKEDAAEIYKTTVDKLLAMASRQRSYTLTNADSYLSGIGTKPIDVEGLTKLVEGDLPITEREAGARSEVKAKAAKFDGLKAKFGVESDEELEAMIAFAQQAKAKTANGSKSKK